MIRLAAATVRYGAAPPRVGPVDLRVGPGERVLLSGPSGSGKTTLLRLISGAAGRSGTARVEGLVEVLGADPGSLAPPERPQRLGYVPQNPDDALVGGTVGDELAFGPRCAGRATDVAAWTARVGLRVGPGVDPRATSQGERQRLAVGAALSAGASVLLLDEPLAHLDPAGAARLLEVLDGLSRGGVAMVLAEHRLARVVPWASRQVVLERGCIVRDGVPGPALAPPPAAPKAPPGGVVLEARAVPVVRGGRVLLPPVDVTVRAGERVALLGPNGIGKTTLLEALAALAGRRGVFVPSDPDLTLFSRDVWSELAFAARRVPDCRDRVTALAARLGLEALLDRPPHAASRGQRLRIAVGAALTGHPEVLLLDEPTAGQDADAVERLFHALADPPVALVFATHDTELAERWAHRVVHLGAPP